MALNPQPSKAEMVFPDPELLAALDADRPAHVVRILPFVKDDASVVGRQVARRRF